MGTCTKLMGKMSGSGGIRTHAPEETGALNQRLRPLGHATGWCAARCRQLHYHNGWASFLVYIFHYCLFLFLLQANLLSVFSLLPGEGQTMFLRLLGCQKLLIASTATGTGWNSQNHTAIWIACSHVPVVAFCQCLHHEISGRLEWHAKGKRSHRDLNSDRWIQSPEC